MRPNLTVNLGLRWEPFLPVQEHVLVGEPLRPGAVRSERSQHRCTRRRRPGLMFPGDDGYPGDATTFGKMRAVRAARGRGLDAERRRADERPRVVGRLLRHAAPVLQHALREQPAVGRADHDLRIRPAVSPIRISAIPGGNPFPALNDGWATQPFPAFGVYVNTPLHLEPTSLQQWNVSVQRQFGDWLASAQLSRQPLEPSVARDRAEPGGLRPRRDDRQHQPRAAC